MPPGAADNPAPAESDPRFPSGPWTGFWMQRGLPTRPRMQVALAFSGGKVSGSGRDAVGIFEMAGTYELVHGRCLLVKQYLGAHRVIYEGANEGDGQWLWGVWRLPSETGGFHLWPVGEEDPTQLRKRERHPNQATRRAERRRSGKRELILP